MSMFESTLFHKVANCVFAMIMLCAITKTMPSKTEEYNYANMLSQAVIILSYLGTILLADRAGAEDTGIDTGHVDLALILVQLVMMLYLIYISTNKLKQMVRTSKAEVELESQLCARPMAHGSPSSDESDVSGSSATATVTSVPAQAVERAFRFFDKDGSGGVNLAEICTVLELVGIQVSAEERRALSELACREMWGGAELDAIRAQVEASCPGEF